MVLGIYFKEATQQRLGLKWRSYIYVELINLYLINHFAHGNFIKYTRTMLSNCVEQLFSSNHYSVLKVDEEKMSIFMLNSLINLSSPIVWPRSL